MDAFLKMLTIGGYLYLGISCLVVFIIFTILVMWLWGKE